MDQDQKNQILTLIQDTLGIEDVQEITPESEFVADLNASLEEIKQIIDSSEEILENEIDISGPYKELTVEKFFEVLEESFI
jgi:acyl carrier protein